MKNAEDISILITDKEFQKVLLEWNTYDVDRKNAVCKEFQISEQEIGELLQLWHGMDFKTFEVAPELVETAFDEMIWKLANKRSDEGAGKPVKRLFNQFARIAAVLILPILLYTGYLQFYGQNRMFTSELSELVNVNCQRGTVTNLTLPDGSQVWLNAGSTISYPNRFSGNTRQVTVNGEAYFEVVKNKKLPMVVSVGDVDVKVYGTSFNVNTFSDKTVKVTLVEGSVALSTPLTKFYGKDEFLIKPGQTVSFDENSRELEVKDEDTFYYTAWKDGVLVFRNAEFRSIAETLSRRFNVDIEIKDQNLASVQIDATFNNEGLTEILRLLSLSTPFTYRNEVPQKLPDGSYEKSKIYIEKK